MEEGFPIPLPASDRGGILRLKLIFGGGNEVFEAVQDLAPFLRTPDHAARLDFALEGFELGLDQKQELQFLKELQAGENEAE
jgi:hypothetical protein